MKYDDGIIVSHERPLNPKTKRNRILDKNATLSPTEKVEIEKQKDYFKDFDNKKIETA